ncbi:MAG TPA: alkaline phosphatase, partial [Longimicrobiales bacterium]|nr:alkaline phosphatase [Longimicrobiales bacterium]
MKRTIFVLALAVTACSGQRQNFENVSAAPAADDPFSVILFIGDGTGAAAWTAARFAAGRLSIDDMPVAGTTNTEASDSRVTDSAAGATAYATGVRTFNGAIGVRPDSSPVETVLEVAEVRGMATGLIATSTITHATPASFAAHQPSRQMHDEIAADMAEAGVDVLLGGGKKYFDPRARSDGRDLLSRVVNGGAYVETAAAFRALALDTVETLVGFFAEDNPSVAAERDPSLPELTRGALEVLSRNEDGFFLMVEGSQIDWRAHDNAPLEDVVAEVLDFDAAIAEALAYQREHSNTLVLVVSDHETGGMALQFDSTGAVIARYTTTGHTGEMVPHFAAGPGAAAFAGVMENYV